MPRPAFSVRFDTLGCRLNQLETETLAAAFLSEGFSVTDGGDSAHPGASDSESKDSEFSDSEFHDPSGSPLVAESGGTIRASESPPLLCVVNTCAVTGKAEQKARRLIRLLRKRFPGATVIVTGCYAQTGAETLRAMDSALVVLPGRRKDSLKQLPSVLKAALNKADSADSVNASCSGDETGIQQKTAQAVRAFCLALEQEAQKPRESEESQEIQVSASGAQSGVSARTASGAPPETPARTAFSFHSRASVKIQDGCSNRCAFCKTRLARGMPVSVPAAEIVSRIQTLEKAGWGEVVLTGVNLHQYANPADGAGLPGLLRMILQSTARIFVRISSLYPESVTEEFAGAIRDARVCPFFHLSVQSGSARILGLMRRNYTPDDVRAAAAKLRDAKENPFLSCDIITGFPGETDADFRMTEALCREIGFAHIHAFPFSPRPGTEAASMRPRVPERTAGERVAVLEALAREGNARYRAAWDGKELPAIFEYSAKTGAPKAHAHNGLSFPLRLERGAAYPPGLRETFAENPAALRGAQIRVKLHSADEKPWAELVNFTN